MDISTITNPEAQSFIQQYLKDFETNREVYEKIPEDQLDYRMVNTPKIKSDSPRESIIHEIKVMRNYIDGIQNGEVKFGIVYDDLENLTKYSKNDLLNKFDNEMEQLIALLSTTDIKSKTVTVPWFSQPIPAVTALWSLDSHEILHTGWNIALMDHLEIERFPKLKAMWG